MITLSFVSSPYTFIGPYKAMNKRVEKERYLKVVEYVADKINEGEVVFSPIVHCHVVADTYVLPTDWEYWGKYCRAMLERCQRMYVLMLEGWEESTGVQAEIEIANELKIEIIYVPWEK